MHVSTESGGVRGEAEGVPEADELLWHGHQSRGRCGLGSGQGCRGPGGPVRFPGTVMEPLPLKRSRPGGGLEALGWGTAGRHR